MASPSDSHQAMAAPPSFFFRHNLLSLSLSLSLSAKQLPDCTRQPFEIRRALRARRLGQQEVRGKGERLHLRKRKSEGKSS